MDGGPPRANHMGRLIGVFPGTGFVCLVHGPCAMFRSAEGFFAGAVRPLGLRSVSPRTLRRGILSVCTGLCRGCRTSGRFVPRKGLVRIGFRSFRTSTVTVARRVCGSLSVPKFRTTTPTVDRCVNKGGKCGGGGCGCSSHAIQLIRRG